MIKIFCDKKEKDLVNFWNHMVFHPTNSIEDDWGKMHLDKLAEDKAVQIVRIYSMFEESVTLGEDGELKYDFALNDLRIDELLKRGFTPYIGYTFFPQFLSVEHEDNLISRRYKDTIMMRSYMSDYSKCTCYTSTLRTVKTKQMKQEFSQQNCNYTLAKISQKCKECCFFTIHSVHICHACIAAALSAYILTVYGF